MRAFMLSRIIFGLVVLWSGFGYAVYIFIVQRNTLGAMLACALACVAAGKIIGLPGKG